MSKTAPVPLGHEATRTGISGLKALKSRTLLTAMTALLCGFFGIQLIIAPLSKLGSWAYSQVMRQGDFPLVHVPLTPSDDIASWLPQAAFLLVSALALIGFSAGTFGRTPARVVMIPPLLLGLGTAFFLPATSQWMHIFPSKLERAIMHGQFDAADSVLSEVKAPAIVKHYVQAQIALRAGDELNLKTHGEAVLNAADQIAYELVPNGKNNDPAALRAAVQFKPEIVHALDIALNRVPVSQVGIQWQKEHASHSAIWEWLSSMARLGLALALLAAGLALIVLWNRMRQRISVIQAKIMPETHALPL